MTFDTFESLKVGNRLKPVGKVRTYPVVRIGKNRHMDDRRVVYVCLNPTAVEKGTEEAREVGIFAAGDLDHSSHYINWDRIS